MPLALDGHRPTAAAAADIAPMVGAAGRGRDTARARLRGPGGETDLTAGSRGARTLADT